ncbi:MAG: TetR/AcrR family transcriptional regulator, partial [Acetobacteraceae bacterium]|nr:TetR/AcrR family transcriptional regulator [Acetobacteraceae bacterium]
MAVTRKRHGQHHHGDLRRALLDAVAELVLEVGPDAVTLRECARRAGVSHSAAAPHFGD